uniref:Isoleucine--tRNA ligase, cytoplasmic n=1 Tax=Lepeophtheirus salmonis TaxID=72036 RepID=A0A0K2TFA5_LEPSM
MESLPSTMNFPHEEERIEAYWKDIRAFETSLKMSKGKPRYVFFDGPPFATGLPHYGHILAGTIKDIVTRYAHGRGFHVERRFGWDTHGLPVEHEIDKLLGIKSSEDVAKMGIAAYNAECRKIVMRYSQEWERTVTRLGRWIDFKNDYKTLYPWYMESIWWVFKQLWEKGFIYQGFRVMPYSTGCTTPLANFEASQNFKDVQDPSITIMFPLEDEPETSLLAWTTTPWTLPSNLACCVNPESTYVKVKEIKSSKLFIVMEVRLSSVFKKESEYEILEKFKGSALKDKKYKPLFEYFKNMKSSEPGKGAFRILVDTYVTEDSGTGVVQQAPYFGEDDYRVCLAAEVIYKGRDNIVCPLDDAGRFVDPVTDFKGQYVKDADKEIIMTLKKNGRLYHATTFNHSYPFCWRSDTPLIYRAVPSWFMRVQHMTKTLLEKNEDTYWVPDSIKEGRFGNWLRDARDWNISRNRYWGTPIPVWASEDGEEFVCIGSIDELEKLSGVRVSDLHRDTVDSITIPSAKPGNPPLKRITEVFDCWFESGSMPYAQVHYPFENKKDFEDNFPADFIAEGADQTRGWFYTLLVLSTAIFNKPPFKNLIVNGMVLASDGQKMSKRKKNYPDPMDVIHKYGADALRLYLINSPVVKAESLRFKEDGVKDILKDVFLPWFNALRFLNQTIDVYTADSGQSFRWSSLNYGRSSNVMDKWILSFTQSLLQFVQKEMAAYRLYTVLPKMMNFIDNLTNWYVRMNRKRLKGEGNECEDRLAAIETLFSVLLAMVRLFAPYTPFLTERMFQNLRPYICETSDNELKSSDSIHYVMLPNPNEGLIDINIERSVSRLQSVIDVGRIIRDRRTMPQKYPLPEAVIIHTDPVCLQDIKSLEQYIKEELNVKTVTLSSNKNQYGVKLRAEPDHKILGARLKGEFKAVMKAIKELKDEELSEFLKTGILTVLGHQIEPNEIRILYTFDSSADSSLAEKYEAHSDSDILVLLNCTPDQSMLDEGIAREVVNRVQKLRKSSNLTPQDDVTAYCEITPIDHALVRIIKEYSEYIESPTKSPIRLFSTMPVGSKIIGVSDAHEIKGAKLVIKLADGFPSDYSRNVPAVNNGVPKTPFVNLVHGSMRGALLLSNPSNGKLISFDQLATEIRFVFDLSGVEELKLFVGGESLSGVSKDLNGKTIFINGSGSALEGSCCKFLNVTDGSKTASFLLENPVGEDIVSFVPELTHKIFKKRQLYRSKDRKEVILSKKDILSMNGNTVFV